MTPAEKVAEQIEQRRVYARPPRLGCSLVAHRDLGYCGECHPHGPRGELTGWQLLSMRLRGMA